jgi:NitT/TauT family transport system substrate-binding protein
VKKIITILLIVSLFLVSCGPSISDGPQVSEEPLIVANNFWPGKFWITIADEKGWFNEVGLNIQLVDVFDDYFGSIQGTLDGETHVNGVALYDLISLNAKGSNLVLIINADNAATSDALVVKKEIKTFSDLIGKKIAVSKGFYTEYMLQVALNRHGLNEQEIIFVYEFKDEAMGEAFKSGKIDGYLSWQPQINIALENGGHVLWDASDIPGISPNGQVVLRSLIEERPEDIQAYVNVWYRVNKWMQNNKDEGLQIISEEYGIPITDVKKLYESEKINTLIDNKVSFSYAAGFESLHGTARQINDFMKDHGITNKTLDSADFIDARFIRNVEE